MFAVSSRRMPCVTPSHHPLPVQYWTRGASLALSQKRVPLVLRGMHTHRGIKMYFMILKCMKSKKNRRELSYRKIIVSFKLVSSLWKGSLLSYAKNSRILTPTETRTLIGGFSLMQFWSFRIFHRPFKSFVRVMSIYGNIPCTLFTQQFLADLEETGHCSNRRKTSRVQ